MANQKAERLGWGVMLGRAGNDMTAQPKRADAEDLIAHIKSAQARVKSTWDAHQQAIQDYENAQQRLADYLDDAGISQKVKALTGQPS